MQCNFKGYNEIAKFFLIENLPRPFLFGYPFFKKRGNIFDLTRPNVTFKYAKGQPSISLISMSSSEEGTISLFNSNNIFCPNSMDISEEEVQEKLKLLLEEFEPVFDSSDKTQANVPEIDIPLKNKFENKVKVVVPTHSPSFFFFE